MLLITIQNDCQKQITIWANELTTLIINQYNINRSTRLGIDLIVNFGEQSRVIKIMKFKYLNEMKGAQYIKNPV